MSAHNDNGGINKITFNHDNGGLAEMIVSNGGSLCNKVHSLTTYNDNSFALSDTGDSYIKAYKPTAKQCSVVVGNGKGTRLTRVWGDHVRVRTCMFLLPFNFWSKLQIFKFYGP